MSESDTIFVQLVDGTEAWVPVKCKPVGANNYEILNDDKFEELNTSELWEFLPGDVVVGEPRTFQDGTKALSANTLIQLGHRPDRKFWQFMFLATTDRLTFDQATFEKFEQEIYQLTTNNERFIYPAVQNAAKRLMQFVRRKNGIGGTG